MLHPLAYHRFVMEGKIERRAFWFPIRDDRVQAVGIVRNGGGAPPAFLAGVGVALLTWRGR